MYTFLFRHSFQIDPGQVQTRFCEATWWWGPQGGWGNTTSSPHHHRGWRHQCIKHRFHQVSHIPRLCFGFKILDKDFRFQDDRRMSLWFPFLNWQDRMEALQMAKDIKCAACEADVSFPDVFCVWTGDWKSMDFLKRTKPCLLLVSNAAYTPYFFVCLNGATFRGNKPLQPSAATPGLVGKFAAASRILYWGFLGSGRKVFLLVSAELTCGGRSINQFKILWSAMGLVSSGF